MISLPFAVPQISAKLIFGVAFALCFALIGMGIHKTFSDRKIARMEKTHAELVAKLHRDRADAEAEAREIEQQWRNKVTLQEADYMAAMAQRDHIVRDLVIVGNGLRNKLSQLTSNSQAAAAASPACRDVHKRVETLAVLLDEADRMAEESGRAADDLGNELRLCRGYVEAVTKKD